MEIKSLENELNSLAYHGRGIIIGKSADSKKAITAYFIMGRSENSRNRIFERYADALLESGLFCDISKVGKLLSEMFGGDCPCNYGFGDEDVSTVVSEYDVEWCEQHCDDEEYDKCWTKFAEAKLKEQRQ